MKKKLFKIENLFYKSIKLFYKKQKNLVDNNAHERSSVSQIAHILQNKLKKYSVDTDYNRHFNDARKLNGELIFPDLIVHERNTNTNILVCEFKKDKLSLEDTEKIKQLCDIKGEYKYVLGYHVILQDKPLVYRYNKKDDDFEIISIEKKKNSLLKVIIRKLHIFFKWAFTNKKIKKVIITLIIIVLVCPILIYLQSNNFFIKANIGDYQKNVVQVLSYKDNELIATGSGVYVDNSTVYTNAHVVEDADKIEIININNKKIKVLGLQDYNSSKDIAIIKTDKNIEIKTIKTKCDVKSGESIYAIGYPLGLQNTISDGIVSGEYKGNDISVKAYQHSAPISSGSSGGALFNKRGVLIGINTASYLEAQNLNIAINICEFNDEHTSTKDDEITKVSSSDFFNITELNNTQGKELYAEICSIDSSCSANKSINYFDFDNNTQSLETEFNNNIEYLITFNAPYIYTSDVKNVRVFLIKVKNDNEKNINLFKQVVQKVALRTRDDITDFDYDIFWNKVDDLYYYIEYSKGIDIEKIIEKINLLGNSNYSTKNLKDDSDDNKIEYTIGEKKIIQPYVPAKAAYTEKRLSGTTTSWGLKTRYEVGQGKDIVPGRYTLNTSGWANYGIFIGSVDISFNSTSGYSGEISMSPLANSDCYISERSCPGMYAGYKRVVGLNLSEGNILYVDYNYSGYGDQSVSLRFEAEYIDVYHQAEPEKPEISVQPLKIIERNNNNICSINNYIVNDCSLLNKYNKN